MRKKWDELDLFRGFAALFMLVNHAGFAWLQPQLATGHSFSGILTFIGSFAPVLFFFATGIGYGLQSAAGRTRQHTYGLLNKVCILLLCDQFSAWSGGVAFHFDFLSFIALSMLILEIPRRAQRPVFVATAALLAAFALRFGVGSLLASIGSSGEAMLWIYRILGRTSTPGSSYPLLPWICFPLAGFLLGFFAQRNQSQLEARFLRITAAFVGLATLAFSTAGFLIVNNHPPTRWGTLSISYFCLSGGVLALSGLLALAVLRVPMLAPAVRRFSLRGMSSLSVVPLHYLCVALFGLVLGTVSNEAVFLVANIFLITVVFPASRLVATVGNWAAGAFSEGVAWFVLIAATTSAGVLLALLPVGYEVTRLFTSCTGQLCLCLLLVVRSPRRAKHPDA